jgi:hypothetical protein
MTFQKKIKKELNFIAPSFRLDFGQICTFGAKYG